MKKLVFKARPEFSGYAVAFYVKKRQIPSTKLQINIKFQYSNEQNLPGQYMV